MTSSLHAAIDYNRGLSDAWTQIATFVPKLVVFLLILLVGWVIAKVLAKAVNAVLERVGFDRAVERGGVRQALSKSKYDASDIVAKLVYYFVILITLSVAFGVFGNNPISDALASIIAFLPRLVVAIVILVIAAAIAAAVKDIITNVLGGLSYGKTLGNIASVFIIGIGVIAALNQIKVATTVTTPILIAVLAAIAGVVVVGVGGGLIVPMRSRWERWLMTAESESANIKAQAAVNGPAYAATRKAQAQAALTSDNGPTRSGASRA